MYTRLESAAVWAVREWGEAGDKEAMLGVAIERWHLEGCHWNRSQMAIAAQVTVAALTENQKNRKECI